MNNILAIFGFKSNFIKIISMLKLIPKISLATRTLLAFRGTYAIHHDGTEMPRQFSFYYPPQQKKLLNNKKNRVIPQQLKQYHDTLVLPGYNEQNISELYMEYRRKKVNLSSENIAMLIHMFTRYNIMTSEMFDLIEKQAFKLKGQYKSRSIFGALRGSIIYNRQNMIDFFIEQFKASDQKLTMHEMLQILQAINTNRLMSKIAKNKIWAEFKPHFVDGLMSLKIKDVDFISRVFDGLRKIKEKDEKIWERVIKMMKYKKGWNMIPVFQRLYQISGQFESAKRQFDHYFQKMAKDIKIMERYNLTQVRYRTPLQIIKQVEQNPTDYQPKLRTLVPEGYDPKEWNQKYEEFLKVGSIKQEQQIIKDKSKSLGFAIKERYQSLTADGIDFSKLDKQQFNQMFGDYNTVVQTINEAKAMLEKQEKDLEANPHLYQNQQEQQEEKQNKKEKGKGKGKQEAKDKGNKHENQDKNKKQKGDKQQKKQKGKKKKQQ